ncbi:MAG: phosphomethylpyrimidine kinase [Peptococcaceae bacterium BICA1-7]|nr:MAG: phosphomethylpyrimidine kinase [Peptococcaceae bacterium BICA1-7]HBV99420.1 bifunctional hydroxymethylpyrimidine kinase/phosphomethylpyrimidine kinase [Desulfotomaculum sp.]
MIRALTIAGSDSGAGAGIQADLKTFSALGVYASTVITAVTAQNSLGVFGVQDINPEMVKGQLEAVLSDIGADAVKIGMLSSAESIGFVAEILRRYRVEKVVLDPVITTSTGFMLISSGAIGALTQKLLPLAGIVTPNIPEAEILTKTTIKDIEAMKRAARALFEMGVKNVLVKGGHLSGRAVDVFYDGSYHLLEAERIDTDNTHGTGCTLSSAIAAYLARGLGMLPAVTKAKEYITGAIRHSFKVGQGPGPVNHFFDTWDKTI